MGLSHGKVARDISYDIGYKFCGVFLILRREIGRSLCPYFSENSLGRMVMAVYLGKVIQGCLIFLYDTPTRRG
jgi:hypothetical protein